MNARGRRESIVPKVENREDVDGLSDLVTAVRAIKQLGIKTEGINDLEDAKMRLYDYLNKSVNRGPSEPDPLQSCIKALDIVKDDSEKRENLRKIYEKSKNFLSQLPENIQNDLEELFPDFKNTMESKIQELQKRDCVILLAGETGSGKSSLVNLLLQKDVLPTSPLCCTDTFCEIRGSTSKYAIIHFKDKSRKPQKLTLNTEEALELLRGHIRLPDDPELDCEAEKVEVYWPSPLLKDGLVFIDSPGIGENKEMCKHLASYMRKAFGFLYVINSSNAGGVQKDRLEGLLRMVLKSVDDEEFLSEATIFVSNKWEMIPQKERKEMWEDTLNKLQKYYPSIRNDQLICISTTKISKALEFGVMREDFNELLKAVKNLIPATLKNKMFSSYSWLSSLLKRCIYAMKVTQNMGIGSLDTKTELYASVRRKIEILENKSKANISDIKLEVMKEIKIIQKNLVACLLNYGRTVSQCQWSASDYATKGSHWRMTGESASNKITKRVENLVNNWEENKNYIKGMKASIIEKFKDKFAAMEEQILNIESTLLGGQVQDATRFQKSLKRRPKPKGLVKVLCRSDTTDKDYVPSSFGFIISSLGQLDIEQREIKRMLKAYAGSKLNDKQTMIDLTTSFVKSITDSDRLEETIRKFFTGFLRSIDALGSMVPELLKADLLLLKNMERKSIAKEEFFMDAYPKLIYEISSLQGGIELFYVHEIMIPDVKLQELIWNPMDPPLGSGSFATVYACKLIRHGNKQDVAIKAWKEELKLSNVADILLEDHILREINHPNIVKYYGVALRPYKKDLQWIMVMEYCPSTLQDHFIGKKIENPGKLGTNYKKQEQAMLRMAQFARQICNGLVFIHEKNMMHRDLKLENVLVTKNKEVKLTDVGLAKPVTDITGTIAGSPCYMAPEIFDGTTIYDQKADSYSFAVMMWEMWYGIDAADHLGPKIVRSMEHSVKNGLRPSVSISSKPPDNWKEMMVQGWDPDPIKRPTSRKLLMFFDNFIKNCSQS